MASDIENLHPMFKDMLSRSDGWTDNVNESSLDYNFMTRHPTMSVMFLIFTSIAAAAGNIGNVLVIGAVISYRPLLRNKGSMFVINLAIADLCITGIVCPMNMIGVTKGPRFFLDKVQLCNLLGSICTVSCIVSMLSIAAVAVNRLIQICKFFLYHRIFTHKKTILYCVSLWLLAIVMDLPNWLGWGGHTFGLKEMGCTFDRIANHSYTIFLATMSIAVPMIIVLTSYLIIILYVRHCRMELKQIGSMSKKRLKDEIQFAVTLFVSFIAFVISWTPYMIAILFDYKDLWPKQVYVAGTLLGHSNSCFNPIIYALACVRFRKGYYVFLHKIFCLKITKDSYINDSKNGTTLKFTSKSKSPVSTPILDRSARIQDVRLYKQNVRSW
ncbi:melatonin receptor type 1B-like isoform X1 [Mercenaria mercenaria]|uniref:melatonin receptor type 1B-like isoform X1 n=1 Tax=Mercenaria mercenaria TaxID=6596 RepID=UPI00234F2D2E|nr:melatonin receptor type 1B-like isoform X1 [Mercenaria mercenaria]XP_045177762.2 melatonin receptor type 1B-like isoform X1 [Mercenaria mercenaria]XP_045177763.2 melatonin receptor type 1B-like isoform X1 [Mercenaria mercenaria]XP_053385998.1 melatonin receptor type 1B-like isoform X1 [Mercenaria mercenaria]